jgi:hypothetical protein
MDKDSKTRIDFRPPTAFLNLDLKANVQIRRKIYYLEINKGGCLVKRYAIKINSN